MRVQSLGWDGRLEEGMTTHSSILTWRILWTEEPGGLQSIGSQRVGHNWSNLVHTFAYSAVSLLGRRQMSWNQGIEARVVLYNHSQWPSGDFTFSVSTTVGSAGLKTLVHCTTNYSSYQGTRDLCPETSRWGVTILAGVTGPSAEGDGCSFYTVGSGRKYIESKRSMWVPPGTPLPHCNCG